MEEAARLRGEGVKKRRWSQGTIDELLKRKREGSEEKNMRR